MALIKFPYTNLHEINLDWLIEKVKEAYSPDNPPDDVVLSVNGDVGNVVLYKEANVQLPSVEDTSWNFFRLADGTACGIKFTKGLPLQRIHGTYRYNIYDQGNPPPYPVTSVNGQTGAITVQIAFGSLTGDTISFLTASPDHSWSLDRETLDGAASIRIDTTNDEVAAYLDYVSQDDTVHTTVKLLTPADIPSSSGVLSVNGQAGVVLLTGDDIPMASDDDTTLSSAINDNTSGISSINNKIGNTAMGTTATTITGAIKEHNNKIGNTAMGTTATTLTGAIKENHDGISAINTQLAKAYTNITEFYDNRCENIGSGESTVIFKTGNVYICSIAVNFLVTPTSSQTSIITLPSGIPAPSVQTWAVVYNRTTGNVHTCAVSTSGNINVINRGLITAGDKVEGQIVWIA